MKAKLQASATHGRTGFLCERHSVVQGSGRVGVPLGSGSDCQAQLLLGETQPGSSSPVGCVHLALWPSQQGTSLAQALLTPQLWKWAEGLFGAGWAGDAGMPAGSSPGLVLHTW